MGGRDGGTEDGTTAVSGASHPALWVGRLPSAMKLELARVGAVRRAACAEPICGGNSPSARRPRRRRSSGAGAVGGRELLRRYHEGSQERGRLRQRAGGSSPSAMRLELARVG